MESDDLPSPACPLRAKESRTVKRVPFSRFFPDAGFALLSKMEARFGSTLDTACRKKSSQLRDSAKIKDGVMGSEDRIRYPRVPNQLNVYSMSQ